VCPTLKKVHVLIVFLFLLETKRTVPQEERRRIRTALLRVHPGFSWDRANFHKKLEGTQPGQLNQTGMPSFSIRAGTGTTLTHWCNAQSVHFIAPLAWLYTFFISAHKSRAVHAPHVPL